MASLYVKLAAHVATLQEDIRCHATALQILGQKCEDLIGLLGESMATTHLPAHAKKHKTELKQWYTKSLARYKHALQGIRSDMGIYWYKYIYIYIY